MRVHRIEDRIVRQQERAVGLLQLEPDFLPDLHHDGALRERLVEGFRHTRAILRLIACREIERRGERKDVRMPLHERGVEPVHEFEMAVGAGIADVHDAQVDAPQHRVDDGHVLVDVRVHVDLAQALEAGRRRRRRAHRGLRREQAIADGNGRDNHGSRNHQQDDAGTTEHGVDVFITSIRARAGESHEVRVSLSRPHPENHGKHVFQCPHRPGRHDT